jgi:uncharacterized membrane protein YvbJ
MYCNKCGKQIDDNSRFCENCGASFANDSNVQVNKIQYQPQQEMGQSTKRPNLKGIAIILFIIGGLSFLCACLYINADILSDLGYAFWFTSVTAIVAGIGFVKLNKQSQ